MIAGHITFGHRAKWKITSETFHGRPGEMLTVRFRCLVCGRRVVQRWSSRREVAPAVRAG